MLTDMLFLNSTQKNPSQIKAICQAKQVTDHMDENCGDNKEAAMDYFAGVCKDVGVKVGMFTLNFRDAYWVLDGSQSHESLRVRSGS